MLGDDAPDDRETETAAAALGRVVRQEEFLALLRRNARAVVRDDDAHQAVRRIVRGLEVTVPCRSVASMALSTRLMITRRICSASTRTCGTRFAEAALEADIGEQAVVERERVGRAADAGR